MKKKLRLMFMLISLIMILPIFTACDPLNKNIKFLGYEINGTKLSEFSKDKYVLTSNYNSNIKARIQINDPEVVSYKSTLRVIKKGDTAPQDVKVLEYCYSPESNTPYENFSGLTSGGEYYIDYRLYTEPGCKGEASYYITPSIFTYQPESSDGNNENIASPTQDLVNLVGGDSGYCNVDANGVKKVADTNNLFVRVAYSQIGYKEKSTNSSLNSCTSNSGGNNYQKYGNNANPWCSAFVNWALKRIGVEPPFSASSTDMYDWASDKGRLVYSAADCKNGDLALYNGHVGIVYITNSGSTKYVINGNWDDEVKLVETNNLTLNGHTFKGCANMKGYTY